MAGSRNPGPFGLSPQTQGLDDGTMIRGLSPRPGRLGGSTVSTAKVPGKPPAGASSATRAPGEKASQVKIPVLQLRSQGPEVQKLQRLLNTRLTPSPQLTLDGIFGPLTQRAVLQYQQGAFLLADGIVGKRTWYRLVKGDKVTLPQAAISRIPPIVSGPPAAPKTPTAVPPLTSTAPPVATASIWEWPLEDKFIEVLRRTAPKLPSSMRHEFAVLLSPANLKIMAGTLVVWAGAHAFGVGEVIDAVLLVGGALFLGKAIFEVASELGDFLVVTSTAMEEKDLDEAASHLARAIAILGVVAFIALLAKIAKGRGGKGEVVEAPAKLEPATPRPSATATEAPPVAPRVPAKSPTAVQLDEIYAKAPAAKAEIDAVAEGIAKETGGSVAKAPLKGQERALEKAVKEYGGDASKVKDIARNTIVVEQSQYAKTVALLKEQGATVKEIDAAADPMGYSGTNAVVKTKAGMPAEIQVNTPEMIYAKESPANAKAILGEEKYAELAAKTGVPGGLGHQLYEEYRSLPPGDPRAAELAKTSRAYYDHIRQTGGQ